MFYNPSMYEISTRVWIKRFSEGKKNFTLSDVPDSYWDELKGKGIDYVWLMGIWKTNLSSVQKYAFNEDLVQSYKHALKDWTRNDVIGSPYAIDTYEVNELLGNINDLLNIKNKLNARGMKLILDYVPNHFNANSILIKTHPDIFLNVSQEHYNLDQHTYFKPFEDNDTFFAHGRDPFFPAWQDTIQVNYFSITARDFMANTLTELSKVCDGLRCDMAMLALNNIFENTWGNTLKEMGYVKPEEEFWKTAIQLVRKQRQDFIFIAEVYWDLEWEMQQLGFDFTYDKTLTDRLKYGHPQDVRGHLNATVDYQRKSMRFIENHDEKRSVKVFGESKAKAAAIIISTIQGLRFYYDGQFEGKRIKLPVQLGREPDEKINKNMADFYNNLLNISKAEIFRKGNWVQHNPIKCSEDDTTFFNILAWEWKYKEERRLVVVNYSKQISSCRIRLNLDGYGKEIILEDLLNKVEYCRDKSEIEIAGLFIKLGKYGSHIFSF